jgi:hypothetical protein
LKKICAETLELLLYATSNHHAKCKQGEYCQNVQIYYTSSFDLPPIVSFIAQHMMHAKYEKMHSKTGFFSSGTK